MNSAYFTHELLVLIKRKSLSTIRKRVVRLIMDFHNKAVRSNGYTRPREWRDHEVPSSAVRGIHDYGQVRQSTDRRNRSQI